MCSHPPERIYAWVVEDHITGKPILCSGCKECGSVLSGAATLEEKPVMQQEQQEETRETKTTHKAVRLLWLYLTTRARKLTPKEYAQETGIDSGNASRELRYDLPAVEQAVESSFPLLVLLRKWKPLDWIKELPDLEADHSELTVKARINHQTGEIIWQDFSQVFYQGGQEVASVRAGDSLSGNGKGQGVE